MRDVSAREYEIAMKGYYAGCQDTMNCYSNSEYVKLIEWLFDDEDEVEDDNQ